MSAREGAQQRPNLPFLKVVAEWGAEKEQTAVEEPK